MNKNRIICSLMFLFCWGSLTFLSAATPGIPVLNSIENFCGPINVTWSKLASTNYVDGYRVYIATFNSIFWVGPTQALTPANVIENRSVSRVTLYVTENSTPTSYTHTTNLFEGAYYYVLVTAFNANTDGGESNFSNVISPTMSLVFPLTVTAKLLDPNDLTEKTAKTTIDKDSEKIRIRYNVYSIFGQPAIPSQIVISIIHPQSAVTWKSWTIMNSSAGYVDFDGASDNRGFHYLHKHNGQFRIEANVTDYRSTTYANINLGVFAVDIITLNDVELKYRTVGLNTISYSPPFSLSYKLSKPGYVTLRIYNTLHTQSTSDDVLVRTVVNLTPRPGEGNSDNPSIYDLWDDYTNAEIWDGRSDNGTIVPNGLYRYELSAREFTGDILSDNTTAYQGIIALDTLRITDLVTIGITWDKPLAYIQYFLGGLNIDQGGAMVTILICKPGTKLSIATSSGSLVYLGAYAYNYISGDVIPDKGENIVKLFSFYRAINPILPGKLPGYKEESWDGRDESGAPLTNGTYVMSLSAVDDSGNHALDETGNEHPIIGNITIDRTISQAAVDSLAPSVDQFTLSPTPGNIVTRQVTEISARVIDSSQLGATPTGLDVTKTFFVVSIGSVSYTGTKNYDTSSNMLKLILTNPISEKGDYNVRLVPVDRGGNVGVSVTWMFGLDLSAPGSGGFPPPTPKVDALKNFSGALVAFWDPLKSEIKDPDPRIAYYLYYATFSITNYTDTELDFLSGRGVVTRITEYYPQTYSIFKEAKHLQNYSMRMIAVDDKYRTKSNLTDAQNVIAVNEGIEISSITIDVLNSPTDYVLDFDSQVVKVTFSFTGELGSPILPSVDVNVDILTQEEESSVFIQRPKLPVDIVISSFNYSATATYIWNGSIFADRGHKHNGVYIIQGIPERDLRVNDSGKKRIPFLVDVMHINSETGFYTTQGDVQGARVHYGFPTGYKYFLSKPGFFSYKIYDRNQTETSADDTLVRVIVSSVPRVAGDFGTPGNPNGRDRNINTEIWDGRDNNGKVVGNDIYREVVEVTEFWDEPPSGSSGYKASLTDTSRLEALIAIDVLRIFNVSSVGISQANPLAQLKYTIGGANSDEGGVQVKILICTPGTTFSIASATGTISYLNNSREYRYVAGDLIPFPATGIVKVFNFYRRSGNWTESWDGNDEDGRAVENNNYLFGISAVDDSGNRAIDNSGNDGAIIGNVTIDRTVAQKAGDSLGPIADPKSYRPGSNEILSSPVNSITCIITDVAQQNAVASGFDLNATTSSLKENNTGNLIQIKTGYDIATNVFTLTPTNPLNSGLYTVKIVPKDVGGNEGSAILWSFTISIDTNPPQVLLTSAIPSPGSLSNISVNSVSVTVIDLAQSGSGFNSGINITSTTITVADTGGQLIPGSMQYNSATNILTYTFNQPLMPATSVMYTVTVKAYDNANNFTQPSVQWNFAVAIPPSVSGVPFTETVYAYPNPVRNGKVNFSYNLSRPATVKVRVYDLLGNLIYTEEKQVTSAGINKSVWSCINKEQTPVATGVYIYRITVDDGSSVEEVRKKVLIVQ